MEARSCCLARFLTYVALVGEEWNGPALVCGVVSSEEGGGCGGLWTILCGIEVLG